MFFFGLGGWFWFWFSSEPKSNRILILSYPIFREPNRILSEPTRFFFWVGSFGLFGFKPNFVQPLLYSSFFLPTQYALSFHGGQHYDTEFHRSQHWKP